MRDESSALAGMKVSDASRHLALYGLLYLANNDSRGVNVRVRSDAARLRIYVGNAIGLAKSLACRDIPFTLLTNNKPAILAQLESMKEAFPLVVEEIPFNRQVPAGIKFYSAHYKLDVFEHFGTLEQNAYVGLLDLDMVAVGQFPQRLRNLVREGLPAFYDISDQVIPAIGERRILADMRRICASAYEGRWSGGEAILGTPDFFGKLSAEINRIFPEYAAAVNELHHQGDEMVTSVALENLRHGGVYMADLGTLGIVRRFWSIPCGHAQKPVRALKDCFLLHLPADKGFLANAARGDLCNSKRFLRAYWWHLGAAKARGVALRIRDFARRIAS